VLLAGVEPVFYFIFSSGAELVKALETLKLATESGEFDTQLENAGLKHRNNFKK